MSKKFPFNFLSKEEINQLKNKIAEVEKNTLCEIVLSIKEKRGLFEKKKSIAELAQKEFIKAKIAQTNQSTGVLIFILFSERQFYILPDNKILEYLDNEFLQKLADEMSEKFKSGNFLNGLMDFIDKIGEVLKDKFPVKSENKNELPDDIRFN